MKVVVPLPTGMPDVVDELLDDVEAQHRLAA